MCGLIIRFVRADDSAALLRIYAGYIDTPVTFECALPSDRAFAERIAAISAEYPYLVCEEEGAVVGYAYAHRQRDREAYQWNAELSVYLDPAYTRQGLGGRLYRILLDMLRLQGIRTVYAGVTVPNPASERLHESMGFVRLGTYHSTGYKAGGWHDVAWFEKAIAPYTANPEPPLPISQIDREQLEEIIRRHTQ